MSTVTFGEVMLRLAAPGFKRLLQTPRFEATFGGGGANVAPLRGWTVKWSWRTDTSFRFARTAV
jgi:hypothetical protein